MNVPVAEATTRRWGFRELFRQSQTFPDALRTAERQHRASRLDDARRGPRLHHMRPKRSFPGTLISQSVKPLYQFIEQVALLSHALATNEHVNMATCIIRKLRLATS